MLSDCLVMPTSVIGDETDCYEAMMRVLRNGEEIIHAGKFGRHS